MFKALSSETRRKILKILLKKEMHITEVARELGISVPVTAKHVKILEENGLIERKKFGRSHVLHARIEKIYELIDNFQEKYEVQVPKGSTILDVLKEVSGVNIEKVGDREYITSIDGEGGYYIYEVNGIQPDKSINKFTLKKNAKVKVKKIIYANKKEIDVKVK